MGKEAERGKDLAQWMAAYRGGPLTAVPSWGMDGGWGMGDGEYPQGGEEGEGKADPAKSALFLRQTRNCKQASSWLALLPGTSVNWLALAVRGLCVNV